jgi:hypothetical protein
MVLLPEFYLSEYHVVEVIGIAAGFCPTITEDELNLMP